MPEPRAHAASGESGSRVSCHRLHTGRLSLSSTRCGDRAKHQRDEVLGHIDTLRERLSVVVEKIERGEGPGDKDWEGLTRAQQLLQEKARVLAQKDDRNLAVLLEALSWEWTVHKARKNTIAVEAMKQFYVERLTDVLNPMREESIYARMIRNAETIENEIESTEKTVATLRKSYEAQQPTRNESWNEEAEVLYGNWRCAPRPFDVFVKNEQAKAKGEKLRKELDGSFDVRMEGRLALCRLHFEMLKATKTTLEQLGMYAVGDFASPEIDVCSEEWRTMKYQRWRQIKETVKPWKDISPGTWTTELLLPARYPRCGPEISPFPPIEHVLQ